MPKRRIAVVGAGCAGLVVARLLMTRYDVTVFDSLARTGGHVCTVDIPHETGTVPVDVGTVIYSDKVYPLFARILRVHKIKTRPHNFTIRVRYQDDWTTDFDLHSPTLCAPALVRQSHVRHLFRQYLKFVWCGTRSRNQQLPPTLTLGEYLGDNGFSEMFVNSILVPFAMSAWCCKDRNVLQMSANRFLSHIRKVAPLFRWPPLRWRAFDRGARDFITKLATPLRDHLRLGVGIRAVRRTPDAVHLKTTGGDWQVFDEVVLAVNPVIAHRLLEDPSEAEQEVLSGFSSDTMKSVMYRSPEPLPFAPLAWNFSVKSESELGGYHPKVTAYFCCMRQMMNQKRYPPVYCSQVLGPDSVHPSLVIDNWEFTIPRFVCSTDQAQRRWAEISGVRSTHFCCAAWGNGLLESAVESAARVAWMLNCPFDAVF